jgi:hypothetical protein
MKLKISRQIFEMYSYIKFYETLLTGNRVVPCGRADGLTDTHDKANSRFSQICERA